VEWLPWDRLDKIGVVALALILVIAFAREWIVPGPTHRRELIRAEKEAELWRTAFFGEQESRRELEQTGRIIRTAFQAMPAPPDGPVS
jgi:hypothetical protein